MRFCCQILPHIRVNHTHSMHHDPEPAKMRWLEFTPSSFSTSRMVLRASAFRGVYLDTLASRPLPSILRHSLSTRTRRRLEMGPSSERSHPPAPFLRILNSLARQKTDFTTFDPGRRALPGTHVAQLVTTTLIRATEEMSDLTILPFLVGSGETTSATR